MSRKSSKKKTRSKINNNRSISIPALVLTILGGLLLVSAVVLLKSRDGVDPNYVPEVTGGASLKVDKEQIDFGDVPLNEIVTATFVVTNVGDKTLKFTKDPFIEVKEGC